MRQKKPLLKHQTKKNSKKKTKGGAGATIVECTANSEILIPALHRLNLSQRKLPDIDSLRAEVGILDSKCSRESAKTKFTMHGIFAKCFDSSNEMEGVTHHWMPDLVFLTRPVFTPEDADFQARMGAHFGPGIGGMGAFTSQGLLVDQIRFKR